MGATRRRNSVAPGLAKRIRIMPALLSTHSWRYLEDLAAEALVTRFAVTICTSPLTRRPPSARSRKPWINYGAGARSKELLQRTTHVVRGDLHQFDVSLHAECKQRNQKEQKVGGYTEVSLGFKCDSEEQAKAAASTPDVLRVRTMQALAGRIAESAIKKNGDDVQKGSEGDDRSAVGFAMLALGPEATTPDLCNYLDARTEDMARILRPVFPSVARVANYLITHANQQVPGSILSQLIDPAKETAS
jgi:hypothetical protein